MESIINKPNKIAQLQAHYQSPSKTPLYLRGPRDRMWMTIYVGVMGLGMLGTVFGISRLASVSIMLHTVHVGICAKSMSIR
ncbi:uncharacterized protein VTP21DRAFT_11299 [Calcarisporiella thermophila]|uniref:uncharacterized protein n=1 Tax=Calcarisporiella thermophila TaxID=911321 RepID=UPI003742CCB2